MISNPFFLGKSNALTQCIAYYYWDSVVQAIYFGASCILQSWIWHMIYLDRKTLKLLYIEGNDSLVISLPGDIYLLWFMCSVDNIGGGWGTVPHGESCSP